MKLLHIAKRTGGRATCMRIDCVEGVSINPCNPAGDWEVDIWLIDEGEPIIEVYHDYDEAKIRYDEIVKMLALLGNEGVPEYREGYGDGTSN